MNMNPTSNQVHVLVVDDDPAIARLLQQVLKSQGHRVSVARDGQQGLDMLAADPPDLILLDLDMPEVHGYEVCRRVKQAPATRLTPVIIVSGPRPDRRPPARLGTGSRRLPDQAVPGRRGAGPLPVAVAASSGWWRNCDSAEAVVFALARAVEAKTPVHARPLRARDGLRPAAGRTGRPAGRPTARRCGKARCCTTSARSASPTPSSTSPAR